MDQGRTEPGTTSAQKDGAYPQRQAPYDTQPGISTPPTSNGHSNVPNPHRPQGASDGREAVLPAQEQGSNDEESTSLAVNKDKSQKRKPSGQSRICGKCGQQLLGQFVRALGDTYHLECFTCNVSQPK